MFFLSSIPVSLRRILDDEDGTDVDAMAPAAASLVGVVFVAGADTSVVVEDDYLRHRMLPLVLAYIGLIICSERCIYPAESIHPHRSGQ